MALLAGTSLACTGCKTKLLDELVADKDTGLASQELFAGLALKEDTSRRAAIFQSSSPWQHLNDDIDSIQ